MCCSDLLFTSTEMQGQCFQYCSALSLMHEVQAEAVFESKLMLVCRHMQALTAAISCRQPPAPLLVIPGLPAATMRGGSLQMASAAHAVGGRRMLRGNGSTRTVAITVATVLGFVAFCIAKTSDNFPIDSAESIITRSAAVLLDVLEMQCSHVHPACVLELLAASSP